MNQQRTQGADHLGPKANASTGTVPHYIKWTQCPDGAEHVPAIRKGPYGRRWICTREGCGQPFGYLGGAAADQARFEEQAEKAEGRG